MGMKQLPHIRCYWSREEPLFHCSIIAQLMTRDCFEAILRCLHVAKPCDVVDEHGVVVRDKIAKVQWLVQAIRVRCENMWNCHQQLTVDESMVRYKGQYCPIRQFMPNKPVRFGIKLDVGISRCYSKLYLDF